MRTGSIGINDLAAAVHFKAFGFGAEMRIAFPEMDHRRAPLWASGANLGPGR